MKEPVRILHLENEMDDAKLVQMALTRAGLNCMMRVVTTGDDYLVALKSGEFDLILSDSGIPGFDGVSALKAARREYPDTPFIFVSGHLAEQGSGALADKVDWVSKTELERLAPAIERALRIPDPESGQGQPARYSHLCNRLIAVVQQLSLAKDLQTVMAIVRSAARELTGADGATFILREGALCYYADEDAISPLWKGQRFPMNVCISGWVMLNRQPAVIEDIYTDPRVPIDAYRPTFVKSLTGVPIRAAAPVGAICIYWARQYRASSQEVKLLQALADSTSIAIENVQLYSELEQRVRERTAQLEAANRELEAFSYSVSHDLRAPLRVIDGFSQLLLEHSVAGLDDESREYLQTIHRATLRMSQLIEDLLNLSRVARTEMNRETVDLTRIATEIAAELQAAAPARQVELDIAEGVSANGDPRLLRVVLENLLSNAWKYTSRQPQACITFGCVREHQSIYYVRDNGVGFDVAYADRLFGAFQRLHSDAEFSGTGVGLATVQRIIHKHGGRIWAEAAVGEGATFYFTLEG